MPVIGHLKRWNKSVQRHGGTVDFGLLDYSRVASSVKIRQPFFCSPNPKKVIWLFGYLVIFCFCSCLLDFDVQRLEIREG
jgi:hypothetical protein